MKKVLAIIDVQNDFITGALPNPEAQKAVPNIVKKIEEFDGDLIVCTFDTHYEWNYANSRQFPNTVFGEATVGTLRKA